MKKLYIQPNVHVIKMNPSDIIATSPQMYSLIDDTPVNDDINDINDYYLSWGH